MDQPAAMIAEKRLDRSEHSGHTDLFGNQLRRSQPWRQPQDNVPSVAGLPQGARGRVLVNRQAASHALLDRVLVFERFNLVHEPQRSLVHAGREPSLDNPAIAEMYEVSIGQSFDIALQQEQIELRRIGLRALYGEPGRRIMGEQVAAPIQERNPRNITAQGLYCLDDLLLRDSASEDEPKELLQKLAKNLGGRASFKEKSIYVHGQVPQQVLIRYAERAPLADALFHGLGDGSEVLDQLRHIGVQSGQDAIQHLNLRNEGQGGLAVDVGVPLRKSAAQYGTRTLSKPGLQSPNEEVNRAVVEMKVLHVFMFS
jgi:hypothetical protein